ncbi:MAG TPA: deoxyribodipyrimidine photo-lyase, partial [Terracidiphilus sp.]|nr:deoxyribodipyrimidine photo-lyase [Terracidiphilus sp.]
MSASELPAELAKLAVDARVTVRRGGAPREGARCVVYWMQRAMRAVDNPALDVAVRAGNALGLPVVVFFSVIPNYPNANLRHYHFLAQGLRDVEVDAAGRGVGFVVRRHPENRLDAFVDEVEAALVVGDENPCREPERWRQVLAKRLRVPFWTVDADVVVPSKLFGRSYFLLHHFRPHLKAQLPKFLEPEADARPAHVWKPWKTLAQFSLDGDITAGFKDLDRRVKPVDAFTGGTHAAQARLKEFTDERLARYEKARNHPEVKGTSQMSPYLHFGNIGPRMIAHAAEDAVRRGKAGEQVKEKFLDELIGWRELAVLFVRHNPNYDNWESAEPWARKTLVEHAGDTRTHRYGLEALERAATHDDLWNAAQREMLDTGWMHNYMRMYWAKKILEWAPDPERAFQWAVELNDRYELDGRDPNGYAGIAWAIVGKHDRPWFDKPVVGTIRPMSGAALRKKIDAEAYIR